MSALFDNHLFAEWAAVPHGVPVVLEQLSLSRFLSGMMRL
jgi:hypothetical protein